ncbi:hypothetical protein FACS1894172_15290 [Spirochaetia bacterium]|nr:hypothetical protein FACS1894164_04020 [Spirochaetia bacterium]GHU34675.1 hypothetical protein FACS1894172_15290 [Spirochaetia bacterium]
MDTKRSLLDNLPSGINKGDPFIEALFSTFDGEGAINNEIQSFKEASDDLIQKETFSQLPDSAAVRVGKLFTKLVPYHGELNSDYVQRVLAFTSRNNGNVWGTRWDISAAIAKYTKAAHCFIIENTDDSANNLIGDGDFEDTNSQWSLSNGASVSNDANDAFSGGHCVLLPPFQDRGTLLKQWYLSHGSQDPDSGIPDYRSESYFDDSYFAWDQEGLRLGSTAQQTVSGLQAGNYTLHYVTRGESGVIIRNRSGKYFNADKHILTWQDTLIVNSKQYTTIDTFKEWSDRYFFIVVPDHDTITFNIVNAGDSDVYVDYVRLFHKLPYPTYTILLYFQDYSTAPRQWYLSKGDRDPDPGIINYRRQSHFGYSFFAVTKGRPRVGKTYHMAAGNEDPNPEIIDYLNESYFDESFFLVLTTTFYDTLFDILHPVGIRYFSENIESEVGAYAGK